jgi:hypothetical protein
MCLSLLFERFAASPFLQTLAPRPAFESYSNVIWIWFWMYLNWVWNLNCRDGEWCDQPVLWLPLYEWCKRQLCRSIVQCAECGMSPHCIFWHRYVYIYIYTHTHIYIYMYMDWLFMYRCIYVRPSITQAHMYIYRYVCMYISIYTSQLMEDSHHNLNSHTQSNMYNLLFCKQVSSAPFLIWKKRRTFSRVLAPAWHIGSIRR